MENMTEKSIDMLFESFMNYDIEIESREKGMTLKIKRSGSFKNLIYYLFKTQERLNQFLTDWKAEQAKKAEAKEIRNQLLKAARANMVCPYEVGDIFYDSWGYEQTNIDFYQVVEVKPKSVVVRRISGDLRYSDGLSSMAGMTTPVKDSFIGEPVKKPLCVMLKNDGTADYYIKSKHGWISKYEKGENGVYVSWYA